MSKQFPPTLLRKLIEEVVEEELVAEFNSLGSGNVVGYTGPLGADTKAIQKGFWRDKAKNTVKTASPDLHKKTGAKPLGEASEEPPLIEMPSPKVLIPIDQIHDPKGHTEFSPEAQLIIQQIDRGRLQPKNISPIRVQPLPATRAVNKRWILVAGGAELAAFEYLGMDVVPAIIDQIQRESLGAMRAPDDPGPAMPGLWKNKEREKSVKTDSPDLEEGVADKLYDKAPSTRLPYGDTYLQKDDPHPEQHRSILRQVKKNLDKKAYTLHNPPSMGISITNPNLKDKKLD